MKSKRYILQIAGAAVVTAAIASASGGGKADGGGTPPATNVVPGQQLIRESFGLGPNVVRPSGGNGTLKATAGQDIGSFWAEFPGTSSVIWATPGGKQVQSWNFSCTSVNWKEAPSSLDGAGCSNGTASVTAPPAGVSQNPNALLPFAPPPIAYEVSLDMAQQPRTATDWLAVGFTSSNALNNNFENAGQVWIRLKITDVNVDFYHFTVELHTNGLAGQSVASQQIMTGFDTLTVRYDPVNKIATGLYNGVPFGTIPYTANGINHVGFEADAALGVITVDNFNVIASN